MPPAKHLYLQRQLREGLGKDKDRLDRVWLVSDSAPLPEALQPALASRHRAARDADGAGPMAGSRLRAGAARSTCTWSIPLGNWMMRFRPDGSLRCTVSRQARPGAADARCGIVGHGRAA
jgi:hypothetical protein